MAENVADILMNEFNVPWLQLKLTKPTAIAQANGVGVMIERGNK